jgi:hypothetical protein
MRAPHLLRVEDGPEHFAQLFEAIAAAGLRAGWLELRRPGPVADSLEAAAALGARRAVAVGAGRSLALKRLRGEPVLRDLLREHFPGCTLVLVLAPAPDATAAADAPLRELPALFPAGGTWRLAASGDAAARLLDTASLVALLRRPRPWGSAPPPQPA